MWLSLVRVQAVHGAVFGSAGAQNRKKFKFDQNGIKLALGTKMTKSDKMGILKSAKSGPKVGGIRSRF